MDLGQAGGATILSERLSEVLRTAEGGGAVGRTETRKTEEGLSEKGIRSWPPTIWGRAFRAMARAGKCLDAE